MHPKYPQSTVSLSIQKRFGCCQDWRSALFRMILIRRVEVSISKQYGTKKERSSMFSRNIHPLYLYFNSVMTRNSYSQEAGIDRFTYFTPET